LYSSPASKGSSGQTACHARLTTLETTNLLGNTDECMVLVITNKLLSLFVF
jgi:hypothetical protein